MLRQVIMLLANVPGFNLVKQIFATILSGFIKIKVKMKILIKVNLLVISYL